MVPTISVKDADHALSLLCTGNLIDQEGIRILEAALRRPGFGPENLAIGLYVWCSDQDSACPQAADVLDFFRRHPFGAVLRKYWSNVSPEQAVDEAGYVCRIIYEYIDLS